MRSTNVADNDRKCSTFEVQLLDLLELELGSMRLGKVVIKRVSVVKLGVNNGSGDGGGCFGSKI